jgi:hypothetical protein
MPEVPAETGQHSQPRPLGTPAELPGPRNTFPENPEDLTELLGGIEPAETTTIDGTRRLVWDIRDIFRIRYESHPGELNLKPGDPGYNPRHHGPHYHVDGKPRNLSWNQADKQGKLIPIEPQGYTHGKGTGLLPGEEIPEFFLNAIKGLLGL